MLKKVITYEDFDGKKQSETFYFNLTQPEILRFNAEYKGGLEAFVANINVDERPGEVIDLFEKMIAMSYGQKSEDGRYFTKDETATALFFQSAAYAHLFGELMQGSETAIQFFTQIIPAGLQTES